MPTLSLPDKINPWQLAAEQSRLRGELALAELPRFAALLDQTEGVVHCDLSAGIDQQGVSFIVGRLFTTVELSCQRCLGPLSLPLDVSVDLGLAHTDAEANRLPDHYEPLLVPTGVISVAELMEDELLLALPQIPRHADVRECEAHGYGAPDAPPTAELRRPFEALALLLPDSKRSC